MDFTFDEDQLLFQKTVRDFLEGECTPDAVRAQYNCTEFVGFLVNFSFFQHILNPTQ